jgi:hypothetical protein
MAEVGHAYNDTTWSFLSFPRPPVLPCPPAGLLVWFGIAALRDAAGAAESADEEKAEAAEVVETLDAQDVAKLVASTFALVFAAEW